MADIQGTSPSKSIRSDRLLNVIDFVGNRTVRHWEMWKELAIGAKKTKNLKTRQLLISGKTNKRGTKIILNFSAWLSLMFRQAQ